MTQAWTAADLPDLNGATVVVTGASSGLGEVTAREFARVGARVVLAVRDVAKGERAAAAMPGITEVRLLNLGELASVCAFAAQWTGDIKILINNAGIMAVPEGETVDGFELQIGTNHLGHFALTNLLLPHITDRIVTVSSGLHKIGKIDLEDLNWERRKYKRWGAYGQSKLANLLFTVELQRRLTEAGSRVRAMTVHPGVATTNLTSNMGLVQAAVSNFAGRFMNSTAADGALPTLYAATQDLPGDTYVGPGGRHGGTPKVEKRSAANTDAPLARQLWDLSAKLTNTNLPLPIQQ